MKKIFEEFEKEIEIKPIEETLQDIKFQKIPEKNKKSVKKTNKNRKIIIWTSVATIPVVAIGVLAGFMFLDLEDKNSVIKKHFTLDDIKQIETTTFKSLNDILYPKDLTKKNYKLDEKFVDAINNFAFDVFLEGKNNDNFGYSPIALYHHFDILEGIFNDDLQPLFDDFLYCDSLLREKEIEKNYLNNFYKNDGDGMSMYNGFFIDNKYELKKEVISFLTSKYTEAYTLNMFNDKDFNMMLDWVNKRSGFKLNKEEFEFNTDTIAFLFTTMNYENSWNTLFLKEETYKDTFYNLNKEEKTVNYMTHKYRGMLADYGNYVSFYDYYKNNYKIQYIMTKNKNDSLYEVLKDRNFLVEEEEKLKESIIDLSVPRFKFENKIDFDEIFKNTKLNPIFDENENNFNENIVNVALKNSYISEMKQINSITFDENGTIIKSLTSSMLEGTASPIQKNKIILDHEFIYIIKDFNDVPIFMGEYSNAII